MTGLDVEVVVATRHRPESLERCLRSLVALEHASFGIVVVDNGPTAETERTVGRFDSAEIPVRYLAEPRPGASRARNLGLTAASADLIAVTDDDVVVDGAWLTELCEGFTRAPGVACVTGLVLPARLDSDAQMWFETWGGFNKGYEPRLFDRQAPPDAGPLYPYCPGLYGSGNNVAFRAEVLRQLGGYDVALGPGTPARAGEELDLFFSIITGGHRIAYQPSALVWHHHRATDAELATQLRDYGTGLSALMTKWATKSPSHAWALGRRLPVGARQAWRHRGTPGEQPIPARLRRAEWQGMLSGPAALWAGRRRQREPGRMLGATHG
jgi:GT2 family glycosyltransferase